MFEFEPKSTLKNNNCKGLERALWSKRRWIYALQSLTKHTYHVSHYIVKYKKVDLRITEFDKTHLSCFSLHCEVQGGSTHYRV